MTPWPECVAWFFDACRTINRNYARWPPPARLFRYNPPMPAPEPRANPILLGHEDAEATMLDAMRAGRMHHAWLITGPDGVGKATLAYRFARCLLAGAARRQPGARPARPGLPPRRRRLATPTC